MKLDFIDLGKLCVSKANMRYARKAPDVSDILPTVRRRGVIVPVLVRPGADLGTFEIIAGARRFHAASLVAQERQAQGGEAEPMPCAILETGDDADAVEASLIENSARLDPDEVTRWVCFTRLVREGRGVDEVAGTTIAKANAGGKAKSLKTIIRNHLDGAEGREKREGWVPRWMAFPPAAYTERGGVGTLERSKRVAAALSDGRREEPEVSLDPEADERSGDLDSSGAMPLAA